jgi:phage repressor protein C with HTH and peptisase S24 domain
MYLNKIRKAKGIRLTDLSEKLKALYGAKAISAPMLSLIENGKNSLSFENAKMIADVLNCSIAELYGETIFKNSTSESIVQIKYYPDILASAGTGCFIDSEEFETINIDEKHLKEMGIASSYQNIAVIKVKGSSMNPTLLDGDLLFVDTTKKEIYNNRIYIINENNNLKVKRLIRESPFSTIAIVKSDNQTDGEYPPYQIEFNKIEENFICGQVIFFSRNIE